MHEIRDPDGGKARVVPTRSSRSARMQVSRIEEVRDLRVDVIVEELIDERHDCRRCLHLLRGGPGVPRLERLDFAAFEAEVNPGGVVSGQFEEGRILDDMREQSLAFAVRRGRVCPEAVEIRRHRDEPFANRVIEDDLVVVSRALPFISCLGHARSFSFQSASSVSATRRLLGSIILYRRCASVASSCARSMARHRR